VPLAGAPASRYPVTRLKLLVGDERPKLGLGVEPMTHADPPGVVRDTLHQPVEDALVRVEARAGRCSTVPWLKKIALDVPLIADFPYRQSGGKRLPATFRRAPEIPSSDCPASRPGRSACRPSVEPVNANLVDHPDVAAQGGTGGSRPVPVRIVDDTIRKAGLPGSVAPGRNALRRRLLGRLSKTIVATRRPAAGAILPRCHHQREIPRDNLADDGRLGFAPRL